MSLGYTSYCRKPPPIETLIDGHINGTSLKLTVTCTEKGRAVFTEEDIADGAFTLEYE